MNSLSEERTAQLQESFREVIQSDAYQTLKREFDDMGMRHIEGNMGVMAERYIKESGIKEVFRAFEAGAAGIAPHNVDPMSAAFLEEEADMMNE